MISQDTREKVVFNEQKKKNLIKWMAIFLTGLLILVSLPILFYFTAAIFIGFALSLGAPKINGSFGLLTFLGTLFLICSPAALLLWLYLKEKYLIIIFFVLFLFGLLSVFGGDYYKLPMEIIIQKAEVIVGKAGISLRDEAPSGILTLPEDFIPKDFYLGEKGKMKAGFKNDDPYYSKAFYSRSKPGDTIRLMYFPSSACSEFKNNKKYEEATCELGRCLKETTRGIGSRTVSDSKVITLRSKNTTYAIDDSGSCANVDFKFSDEKEAMTEEQMLKVVNSLKRVP